MKKITFEGWKNCIEMVNGKMRLVITTEIGPRIIGAFYDGGENLLFVDPKLAGKKGGEKWVNYGGHRLWHSPESHERTYEPDNGGDVSVYQLEDGGISFVTPKNEVTGIVKTMNIYPEENDSFRIEHILKNEGVWEIEAACWAVTVMAPGGVAVLPQNNDPKALLPSTFVSVWPYTRMNDARITWGDKFLMVRQDAKAKNPMKIGFNNKEGWLAYINKGVAFVKQFLYFDEEEYPDNGCSTEIYACQAMLEAETLGPLCILAPGDEICHVEAWSVFPVDSTDIKSEADAAEIFQMEDECCCEDEDCCCHKAEKKAEKKAAKPAKKAPAKKTAKKAAKK